ncbi:unnamed protein product [Fusarium graminearum]|uniref:Chromosome 3, complete genome n=1 Tax=Gibberella zeae (strain ATCC MYA-4620 / CBS 123657 / FGSC 9075 / NRRL 31084 / PH-1) TaxID=229533 RepID=A0A098DYS7_GIBZE|nr:unnamed protein product [Fusarium graminearum]
MIVPETSDMSQAHIG